MQLGYKVFFRKLESCVRGDHQRKSTLWMAAAQCGSSNQLHLKRLVVTSAVQQQIGGLWPIGWQLHPLAWFQSGGCVAFREHITLQQQNSSQWPDSQLMCRGGGQVLWIILLTGFTKIFFIQTICSPQVEYKYNFKVMKWWKKLKVWLSFL